MRKLILLCGALFMGTLVQAQIQKGDIQLGGTIAFNSSEVGDFENNAFRILPQAGLFVSDLTSIGLIVGYSSTSMDVFNPVNSSISEVTNNNFQFGAYARFHKSVVDNLYLFLQPSVLFGTGENEFGAPTPGDTNSFNVALSPGITYFLSPKFALELNLAGINYSSTNIDAGGGNEADINNFTFGLDLANVGLGLNFYIR